MKNVLKERKYTKKRPCCEVVNMLAFKLHSLSLNLAEDTNFFNCVKLIKIRQIL